MEATFTKAQMKAAYAEHGDRLGFLDEDGDGPFSANPGDYFWAADDHIFRGTLVVRVPEHYRPITTEG